MYILNATCSNKLVSTQFPKQKICFLKKNYPIRTFNKQKRFTVSNSLNESIYTLNSFANNDTWRLVSHGIVNFSVIFFSLNWMYYRSLRIKAEKQQNEKNKKDK